MQISLKFNSPESISASLERDVLVMKIKNPIYFFSLETKQPIPLNATDTIRIPQIMDNNEFTRSFVEMSENAGDLSKASIVSSLFVNLMSSGSMGPLWGLINCLQIVSHFPLISIVQPANSQLVF